MKYLDRLESILQYKFKDRQLLTTALTHSTYAFDHKTESYQRLEYLGDAILDFIVAEKLFEMYPDADEGVLTKKRINAVSEQPLREVALKLGLGSFLRIKQNVATESVIADVVEAIIAGIYLDGGMEEAKKFVLTNISPYLQDNKKQLDYKSQLNELMPKDKIEYKQISFEGPMHNPTFEIMLIINGKEIISGKAGSKKQAEQNCAKYAVQHLNK